MKSLIKLVVSMSVLTLISGCVGGGPQYTYKPASYSSQGKNSSEAAEYCSYIAENKMNDTYDREIASRRARLDQQARDEERRDRESARNNSTTTCTNTSYGYGPATVECKTKGDNYGYQSSYNKQYISDFSLPIIMNKSTNYDRAYRDCMVNEGYKRVKVQQESSSIREQRVYSKTHKLIRNSGSINKAKVYNLIFCTEKKTNSYAPYYSCDDKKNKFWGFGEVKHYQGFSAFYPHEYTEKQEEIQKTSAEYTEKQEEIQKTSAENSGTWNLNSDRTYKVGECTKIHHDWECFSGNDYYEGMVKIDDGLIYPQE